MGWVFNGLEGEKGNEGRADLESADAMPVPYVVLQVAAWAVAGVMVRNRVVETPWAPTHLPKTAGR